MNVQKILVDLDPQRKNQAAISRAWKLARAHGASIELFASEYLHWLSGGPPAHAAKMQSSRAKYLAELEEWLEALAGPVRENGIAVNTHCAWHQPRYEAIVSRADEIGADLIIRSARAHSRLERLLLNATDWELIRHAPQALWLVKDDQPPATRMNVLAAVDPCHPSDHKHYLDLELLDAAKDLSAAFDGELHIFNAFVPPTPVATVPIAAGAGAAAAPVPRIDNELVESVREMHRKRLDTLAGKFGIAPGNTHLVVGDAASGVAEAVDDHDIGIVVVGAVARSWLQRWLVGSTTEAIFEEVGCDVFIVKLEAEDTNEEQRESKE